MEASLTTYGIHHEGLGRTVGFRFGETMGTQTTTRVFTAWLMDGEDALMALGAITIDEGKDEIEMIGVDKAVRRQGLATRLIEVAREQTGLALETTGETTEAGQDLCEALGIAMRGIPGGHGPNMGEAWWAQLNMAHFGADIEWIDD